MTQRANDGFRVLVVTGSPASMTFPFSPVLVLAGWLHSRVLFGTSRVFSPCGRLGRVVGWILFFRLSLFRPLAKKHASDFLYFDPTVLEYPGKFKNEEKIAVEYFPIFFFDFPFCDALAQGLEFLFIDLEFRGLAVFPFLLTRTHPFY